MHSRRYLPIIATLAVLVLVLGTAPAYAQDGTLKIKVKPKSGYTLVDGRPARRRLELLTAPLPWTD